MKITNQDFHRIKKLSLFCHYILLHCINEFHPSNALIYQCQYFGDLSLIETLSPCNTIKYHAIQYNAMQYYAMECNAMQCQYKVVFLYPCFTIGLKGCFTSKEKLIWAQRWALKGFLAKSDLGVSKCIWEYLCDWMYLSFVTWVCLSLGGSILKKTKA